MADKLSKEKRSKIMRSIRSKDTKPEMVVRKLLTKLGYRYRLHKKGLPGKPDIVFIGKKKIIFVHGCFWHVHKNCPVAHTPPGEYWAKKLERTQERDSKAISLLNETGWETLVIWECELKNVPELQNRLIDFLGCANHKNNTG